MPTETEYNKAARGVATRVAELETVDAQHRAILTEPGLVGGTAELVVTQAIGANCQDIASVLALLDGLELELARRATLCGEYTAALERWEREIDRWYREYQHFLGSLSGELGAPHLGARPIQPTPPFPEAEAG